MNANDGAHARVCAVDTGLSEMLPSSGGRRQLVQAAAALIFHALGVLAPEPLETAAALTQPQKRGQRDALRQRLCANREPTGRALLELVARSPLARDLVHSYVSASQRKEKMMAKAQILAPFTAQYSLKAPAEHAMRKHDDAMHGDEWRGLVFRRFGRGDEWRGLVFRRFGRMRRGLR